jgi:hypothetical protein
MPRVMNNEAAMNEVNASGNARSSEIDSLDCIDVKYSPGEGSPTSLLFE